MSTEVKQKLSTHFTIKIGQSGKYCTLEFGHRVEDGTSAEEQRAFLIKQFEEAEPQVNMLLRSLGLEGEWHARGTKFNAPMTEVFLPPPAPLMPPIMAPPPKLPDAAPVGTAGTYSCTCGVTRLVGQPCPNPMCFA